MKPGEAMKCPRGSPGSGADCDGEAIDNSDSIDRSNTNAFHGMYKSLAR